MEGVARQSLPYVTAQTGFRLKILRPWSPVPRFQVCATVPGSSPLALMAGNPEHQLCLCCSPKQSTSCYAGAPSLGWGYWMERSLQSSYSRGWVGNQHAPSIGLEMALQGDSASYGHRELQGTASYTQRPLFCHSQNTTKITLQKVSVVEMAWRQEIMAKLKV